MTLGADVWARSPSSTWSSTTTTWPTSPRHGVTITEIETLLFTAARFVRNKRSAAGDYVAIGNGIHVNFLYRAKEHTARPISAWRL
jgi:hypothetical protein